ncbi:MAG: hemerythrin domain-containing protein [Alphaproteobacteria bacterium]|nr:hemerythrin domain-containing protein [Alphaproteobacteria bacterium]MDP6566882.1 hemerythrin domain-containing protein [Alphaproteobacteria bacterium]
MKLTDALLGEHGAFHALFDQIEALASMEAATTQIQGAMTVLAAMVNSHATLEEDLLFPALEQHWGREDDRLAVMRAEHEALERLLGELEEVTDLHQAVELVEAALELARDHFRKEEMMLFPLADELLDPVALNELGAAWAAARQVTL